MAKKSNNRSIIVTVLGVLVLGTVAVLFIRHIVTGAVPQQKKVVQEVHLIRPPPPPPDEPPPPPPPPEEKVNVPDPQEKPEEPTPSNDPPPSQNLGLDAEGGAGGDAFGLVGNKGGRDLVGSGPGGSVFQWYAGLLKNEILEQLSSNRKVRNGNFKTDFKQRKNKFLQTSIQTVFYATLLLYCLVLHQRKLNLLLVLLKE